MRLPVPPPGGKLLLFRSPPITPLVVYIIVCIASVVLATSPFTFVPGTQDCSSDSWPPAGQHRLLERSGRLIMASLVHAMVPYSIAVSSSRSRQTLVCGRSAR